MKKKIYNTFSSRINPKIQEAVKNHCIREKVALQVFVESALLRELEARRNGKDK